MENDTHDEESPKHKLPAIFEDFCINSAAMVNDFVCKPILEGKAIDDLIQKAKNEEKRALVIP